MPSQQLDATIAMLRDLNMITGDVTADREGMPIGSPMPDDVAHEMVTVAGRPAAWIAEDVRDDAAIVYLHGGGYVLGGLGTHGGFGARLASECGIAALVLDYRLGPEHEHPAALDDALAAIDWLIGRGVAPGRIVVAGDSAGGGLTLATLVALRDRGIEVAAGVTLSPWADLTCSGGSYDTVGDADPLCSRSILGAYARAYAGPTPLDDPALSPAFADLSGLPPVLVQVGGIEVLLDDSLGVAAAIDAAGGPVTLQRWDDAIHVFQMLGAPESDDAIAKIASFVAAHLG